MPQPTQAPSFEPLNQAYNSVFRPNRLSLGLVVPLEAYATDPVPTMKGHIQRAQLAEALGFSALWLRDVPFNVPSFGDAGQTFDPFVYLGILAGLTERIALGVASVVLPLRHPAHVAKAAASADVLSGGRLLLGVASGDRPDEYPALNMPFDDRGERFRESFDYIRRMGEDHPAFTNHHGSPDGTMDMLPKPAAARLPLLITGASQQSPDWIAHHGDGWITYPRPIAAQARVVGEWRARVLAAGRPDQPAMQSLYVDLANDPNTLPRPIHLGFHIGARHLLAYLQALETIGINHVALNLRFNQGNIEDTLKCLADELLPHFAP
ncbi:5,10-methylene tetrahydromethanopterin reductase [Hydrogenophaga crassostreae]|uniref:5,10-methylene tetrahydromethanopterin reductase n=1 Tax=Hydrogenophaga crassostreae TaxID=1763535 RepID=A0A162YRS7_9BURK|nr:LLM class oxidoreductase [Hydrogenophaga crassostreae]AOW14876.1 LLM class oxidoreductase [Hydrogenophaga crassostreae]OAD39702.1 5,10-methylene tetrahydromethanopterin reductase [Hydrogenophaga crassostreae]